MTDIVIRGTAPGDGAGCAQVWREVGSYFTGLNPHTFQVPAAEGLADWFEEINAKLRDDETVPHLVAEVDGVIVGSTSATLQEPLDTADRQLQTDLARRRLHVDSLGIAAAHRRGGVGTALMRAVEEWGRAQGAEVILLETEANNPTSVPFYEQRMGFSPQATTFRKDLTAG